MNPRNLKRVSSREKRQIAARVAGRDIHAVNPTSGYNHSRELYISASV